MKKIAILLAPVMLGGCMTWGGFQQNLGTLVGEPLDVAIAKLGYPSGERTIAGHHIYIWAANSTGIMSMPQTTFGTATATGPLGTTTAYGTSTAYVPVTVRANCKIELEVDISDRIKSFQYDGNRAGCIRFNRRLEQ
jgi:hypothetical protein